MEFYGDPYLRLYLPLWLKDGGSFSSSDLYGHICTKTGALWTPEGHKFDPTDDLINCGADGSLAALSAFTVIAWIKPTSIVNLARILSKEAGWLFYYSTGNKFTLQIAHATGDIYRISAADIIATGKWYQIAGTWDGGLTASTAIKLYANAVESASYTNQNGVGARTDDSANSLIIGNVAAGTSPCDTLIGEVWIYWGVWDVPKLQQIYQATRGRYGV